MEISVLNINRALLIMEHFSEKNKLFSKETVPIIHLNVFKVCTYLFFALKSLKKL